MAKIKIDDKEYKVLDNLGWQPSAGVYAKEVQDGDRKRIIVKGRGQTLWRFWTPEDRLRG
ncbi:MAG: hypothetical protein A2Z38_04100 [Planctomycetes bacterium RBG_19FT_COMBO_48_8]|nr:MAG: hypothetical protein A2Z38_04100 [Planctomycetes bacterium RBG_19FT_COMBO_48_8]